jgi:hypothetical protein
MKKLEEILQLSEIALFSDETPSWFEDYIHPINNSSGLRLDGQSLFELGTNIPLCSSRSELGLFNQFKTYEGFRFKGELVKFPLPGTQPYSSSKSYNRLALIKGSSTPDVSITVALWRDTDGVLKCKINDLQPTNLGNPIDSDYSTTSRRGLRFIIVHMCGAGGGGGRGGLLGDGWGGGSGSTAVALIDMLGFTSNMPLIFTIPGGGTPGTWTPDRPNGDDSNPFILRSESYGEIKIMSGQGGKRSSAVGDNAYGAGGGKPDLSKIGLLSSKVAILGSSEGNRGSKNYKWDGGTIPVTEYIDPNPSNFNVTTSNSFGTYHPTMQPTPGQGGNGGINGKEAGIQGQPGAMCIYY